MKLAVFFLAATALAAELPLHTVTIDGGIRIGWLGDKPAAPAPTVFFLGGAIESSFNNALYQEAVEALGPGVLKVTLDLPGHGAQKRPDEPDSLRAWRYRLDHNDNFVTTFTTQATRALDYLIAEKFTDPAHIAAFGTSRGGFASLHFAAADPRVTHVVGFAPVTNLLMLSEFAAMQPDSAARALSATRLADTLAARTLWITIGSTDDRVGTAAAIEFATRVIESARAQGRQPAIELHVRPSRGHMTPAGSYGIASRWLLEQWR